jgi:hypothetical protein
MVVVGNDESYGNDFFKANERQPARGGLLTIPAEQRVRAPWFTRNKCEWRGELFAAW